MTGIPRTNPNDIQRKLDALRSDLGLTTSRVDETVRLTTDPRARGGLVRATRGVQSAHRRVGALEQLTELIDGRVDVLETALQAATSGGNKAFLTSLRNAQVDDETLSRVLVIVREEGQALDMTDAELFTELLTSFAAFQATLTEHGERLNEHDTALTQHGQQITGLRTDHDALANQVGFTKKNLVVPAIVGVVVALLWWWKDFHGSLVPLNTGIAIIAVGAFAFCLMVVLLPLFSGSSSRRRSNGHQPTAPTRQPATADADTQELPRHARV